MPRHMAYVAQVVFIVFVRYGHTMLQWKKTQWVSVLTFPHWRISNNSTFFWMNRSIAYMTAVSSLNFQTASSIESGDKTLFCWSRHILLIKGGGDHVLTFCCTTMLMILFYPGCSKRLGSHINLCFNTSSIHVVQFLGGAIANEVFAHTWNNNSKYQFCWAQFQ